MNVYDFDRTIFYPDSMARFGLFCVRRHPKLLFKFLLPLFPIGIKYVFKKARRSQIIARYNSIIKFLKNPDKDISDYWKKFEKNLSPWYLKQKRNDDLIISASPEYLLKPLTDKLGVNLIATKVDRETGVMIGNVSIAREKAKYIIDMDMPLIENFYSDSLSDTPLALLAEKAFIVKKKAKRPEPWPKISEVSKKIHKKLKV